MTVGEFLRATTKTLQAAGITSARLDCLVALEDETGHSRAWLLAHPEMTLSEGSIASLNNFITQRSDHLPLGYYRGHSEFYGRSFVVNKHVLVPRPETESMIDLLKASALPNQPKIADIGTGSGCIGITSALEIPEAQVFLYDIDSSALQVAQQNAKVYEVRVQTAQQDLLGSEDESFDVILANLPYVPEQYPINRAATHEPPTALFSGDDGLKHYREFWQQVSGRSQQPALIFTESLPSQHNELAKLARTANYQLVATQGYVQKFQRIVANSLEQRLASLQPSATCRRAQWSR
jgi:release factor glutamine methyltransferase